jgi:hypothetical protein
MKRLLACCALLATAATLAAQQGPPPGPPKSPAATETATVSGKSISIVYSAPAVRGRAGKLFTKDGQIGHDPTYPVWRAGANTATKLNTEADLTIGDLVVPKGEYTLWVDISDPDAWVLVINKQVGQWGVEYDKTKDLGRVKMTMAKTEALVENLKYTLAFPQGTLTLAWENHSASVPVTVN